MAIILYDASHQYRGLEKDCIEYKILRIKFLEHYLDAIKSDNIWMEKHYFQKIMTGIRYDNFSLNTVKGLERIFKLRATWCSYFLLWFCEDLINDECTTKAEKKWLMDNTRYEFRTCADQQSSYHHPIKADLYRLFKLYEYNGFASDEDISRFKLCCNLYNFSQMENKLMEAFRILNCERWECQKSFPELTGDGDPLRFDGCVYKKDRLLLFECQGIQHYEPIDFFGGKDAFIQRQRYDELKKQYCIDNNIPLLCIRYDKNVYSSVKRFISRKTYPDIIYEYKS